MSQRRRKVLGGKAARAAMLGAVVAVVLTACAGGGRIWLTNAPQPPGTRELNCRIYGTDCPTVAFGTKVLEVYAPGGKLLARVHPKLSVEHFPACNVWFRTSLPAENYYLLALIGQATSWSKVQLGPPSYGLHWETGVPTGDGGVYHVVLTLVRH